MKILHVMSELPYPPDGGNRADIWNRLRVMSQLGHTIDILVMEQRRAPKEMYVAEMRRFVNSLQFVKRTPLRKCLARAIPTTIARNSTLVDVQISEQYDIALAEAESTCLIFENPRLQTKIRALRVHNDESMYMWLNAKTEESFVMRQFCRLEALRFVPFSRYAQRRVHSLWFISHSEREKFVISHPAAAHKAVWLPPSIAFGNEPGRCRARSKRVLFVASLNNSLNREGMRWYLNEIHPSLIQYPDYELVVAGSTSGRDSAQLFVEELHRHGRCCVHVDVSDLAPLYGDCAVFINPMQRGTGVKIKNVHAIERRIPVLTTSVGNDGSGFVDKVHVRVADTPGQFRGALTELLNDEKLRERLAARAYAYLREHYDSRANIQQLFTTLSAQNEGCSENAQVLT